MILCHKCAGTFERHAFLYGCGCMSGYPRGFENDLTEREALDTQIAEQERNVVLYRRQGRDENGSHIVSALNDIARLKSHK